VASPWARLISALVRPSAFRENFVDDLGEWRGGVDYDCATRDIFFCCMQSGNEGLLSWFSAEVGGIQRHTLIESSVQSVEVADFKNKNSVKQIDKIGEVSGAAAEKGDCDAVISDHGFNFVDIPKEMLMAPCGLVQVTTMGRLNQRRSSLWIAVILQFPITVEDVITAPLQLLSHCGLAGARDAFDQVISDAHFRFGGCDGAT
jgi:hypothetical protein